VLGQWDLYSFENRLNCCDDGDDDDDDDADDDDDRPEGLDEQSFTDFAFISFCT